MSYLQLPLRNSLLISWLAFVGLSLSLVCAQGPVGRQQSALNVSGTVIDAHSGHPLPDAVVILSEVAADAPHVTRSMEDGGFAFQDVRPGFYRLASGGKGYALQEFGARGPQRYGRVVKVDSASVTGLILAATPAATLKGRVVSDEGAPISGLFIDLIRDAAYLGKIQSVVLGSTPTDSHGQYRFAGLVPGPYKIRARTAVPTITNVLPLQAQYYPGTDSIDAAADVYTSPGVTTDVGIFKYRAAAGYELKGTVAVEGHGDTQVEYFIVSAEGVALNDAALNGAMLPVRDKRIRIAAIAPGEYTVVARWRAGEMISFAAARVSVQESHAREAHDVRISLSSSCQVSGMVEWDANVPENQRTTPELTLRSIQFSDFRRTAQASPRTFSFGGVSPGDYVVETAGLPLGTFVSSISVADVVRSGRLVSIPEGVESLQINIRVSTEPAGITGRVVTTDSEALFLSVVTLVSESGSGHPDDTHVAPMGPSGEFSFRALPPGLYRLYAWDDIPWARFYDRNFLALYSRQALAIELKRGELKSVSAGIIRTAP